MYTLWLINTIIPLFIQYFNGIRAFIDLRLNWSMASSSSIPSSANVTLPTFPQSNLKKLTDSNTYLAWLTQVLLVLRSHGLMGIVDWSERALLDFFVMIKTKLPWILNTLFGLRRINSFLVGWISHFSEKVLATVYGLNTSKQVWTALATRFASQSRARIANFKESQNLRQGSKNCMEYLQSAKSWADQLAAVGKPIEDDDLISYINLQQWS